MGLIMRNLPLPPDLPMGRDVVRVHVPDYFLSLRELAKVGGLSVRTLRGCLADPVAPLPHYRVHGGKIIVRWSEYLTWIERYRVQRAGHLDAIVDEVLEDLRGGR
jgi:hypothetical protein